MYYFYRKSNWGHGICPLHRGGPLSESPLLEVSLYIASIINFIHKICKY